MILLICKTVLIYFIDVEAFHINLKATNFKTDALCSEVIEHESGYWKGKVEIIRKVK